MGPNGLEEPPPQAKPAHAQQHVRDEGRLARVNNRLPAAVHRPRVSRPTADGTGQARQLPRQVRQHRSGRSGR